MQVVFSLPFVRSVAIPAIVVVVVIDGSLSKPIYHFVIDVLHTWKKRRFNPDSAFPTLPAPQGKDSRTTTPGSGIEWIETNDERGGFVATGLFWSFQASKNNYGTRRVLSVGTASRLRPDLRC